MAPLCPQALCVAARQRSFTARTDEKHWPLGVESICTDRIVNLGSVWPLYDPELAKAWESRLWLLVCYRPLGHFIFTRFF